MIKVAKPLITSRFSNTDIKKSCVLNSDVTFESLSIRIIRSSYSKGSKKSVSHIRSQKLKKY